MVSISSSQKKQNMVKLSLFIVVLLLSVLPSNTLKSQGSGSKKNTLEKVLNNIAEPYFIGCDSALNKFIYRSLKYPPLAKENEVDGRIVVRFAIDEKGKVSDITLLKDIGYGCGDEVVRVFKAMPNWMPAIYKNKPIKYYLTKSVLFKLTN